jgi:hypothetical protein
VQNVVVSINLVQADMSVHVDIVDCVKAKPRLDDFEGNDALKGAIVDLYIDQDDPALNDWCPKLATTKSANSYYKSIGINSDGADAFFKGVPDDMSYANYYSLINKVAAYDANDFTVLNKKRNLVTLSDCYKDLPDNSAIKVDELLNLDMMNLDDFENYKWVTSGNETDDIAYFLEKHVYDVYRYYDNLILIMRTQVQNYLSLLYKQNTLKFTVGE